MGVVILGLAALLSFGGEAIAQTPPARTMSAAAPRRGEAYLAYLRGRRLENEDALDEAVNAYRVAIRLDGASAMLHAALASVLLKQDDATEATKEAEAALALDADNGDAHWVLGTIDTAYAGLDGRGGGSVNRDLARKAIEHFEKALPSRPTDLNLLLSLGRLYVAVRDYQRALGRLTELSAEAPGVPQVALLLAEAYEGNGQRADAIRVLSEAAEEEPPFQPVLLQLGALLERDRQWRGAADIYGRIAALNPKNLEVRLRQATALLNAGVPDEARELMRELATTNDANAAVLYLLADAERQARDFAAAERAARRLAALEPDGTRATLLLAQIFDDNHQPRKTVELLQPLVSAQTENRAPGALLSALAMRLGAAHESLGDVDAAIAAFERAKALGASDATPDLYIIQTALDAKRTQQAVDAAAKARQRFPTDRRLIRAEARALQRAGQLDRAVALLGDAIKLHPDDASLTVTLGQVYSEAKQYDQAVRVLEQGVEAFPEELSVQFQLAATFDQQKAFARAEEALRGIIAASPRHAPALNYLGYMLAERGERLDEAVTLIERALEDDPDNSSYLDSLGWAHFKRNDLTKARDYLSRAAQQDERNSVIQDHYGDLLLKLGDRAGARQAWERALAGDGESIDRVQIEHKLRQTPPGR